MITTLICLVELLLATQATLEHNTIGLAYQKEINAGQITLEIVFPMQEVKRPPDLQQNITEGADTLEMILHEELMLFDDKGEFAAIDGPHRFQFIFWCENDGGIQFRPQLITTINRNELIHQFKVYEGLGQMIGFAIYHPQFSKLNQPISEAYFNKEDALPGYANFDDGVDALVYTIHDEAEHCTPPGPINRLVILVTANGKFTMRCCGP